MSMILSSWQMQLKLLPVSYTLPNAIYAIWPCDSIISISSFKGSTSVASSRSNSCPNQLDPRRDIPLQMRWNGRRMSSNVLLAGGVWLSVDNVSSQTRVRSYLEMSPVDMGKDSEHLLVQRLQDGCMEIRGKGWIMFRGEELLVWDSIRYIRHDEIWYGQWYSRDVKYLCIGEQVVELASFGYQSTCSPF